MINTKKELNYYLQADMMMNRGKFKFSFKDKIKQLIMPDYIMEYLTALRRVEYYEMAGNKIALHYWKSKLYREGVRLGFTIAPNVLGYGVVIPHYGTIVVGSGNKIGNYAVLHTSICITKGSKVIGDGLYCSTVSR